MVHHETTCAMLYMAQVGEVEMRDATFNSAHYSIKEVIKYRLGNISN